MSMDYFLPYQLNWINDESAMKFYPKSRRIGITYGTSYRSHRKCMTRKGFTQWVTSRDEFTAKEFITDYVALWAKASNVVAKGLAGDNAQVVDVEKDIRAFVVEYPLTGSRIVSLSSTPEAFAGKGGDVLVDEADLHKDSGKVIDMALPCTTWGDQLEVVSALRVDGHPNTPFCRMMADIETGGNPMGWSYHKTSILHAVELGFVEKINAVTGSNWSRDGWLEMMHGKCRNEAAWQSQYLIVPQDAGGALLNYEIIGSCETNNIADIDPRQGCYVGMDIGRKHDLTVICVLQRLGDVYWTRQIKVLERTPFRDQLDVLLDILKRNRVVRCCIDSTGIGAMLAEEAQRVCGSYLVEAVNFTAPVKEELAMLMLQRFQDKQVRIPQSRELREDLHKVSRVVTAAGNIRYQADSDDDGHSDRFWSLALALHAGKGESGPFQMVLSGANEVANGSREGSGSFMRPGRDNDLSNRNAWAY
jgi:phage FluMu gp28-like protein